MRKVLLGALVLAGCGVGSMETDAGEDPSDAGMTDAGPSPDAGSDPDAGETDPDAGGEPPDAPIISGEASAGHATPTWTWTTPANTDRFRHRLDEGEWVTVPGPSTRHTPAPLALGDHTFEVQAGNASGWSESATFDTRYEIFANAGRWTGVRRPMHVSPYGRGVAVSCHECYAVGADAAESLSMTLARVHDAQSAGADAIELGVVSADGTWIVAQEERATGAALGDVLADEALASGDQILVLRLYAEDPSSEDLRALARLLVDAGHAINGRPVWIFGFESRRASTDTFRTSIISDPEFTPSSFYFRFGLVLDPADTVEYHAWLDTLPAAGYDTILVEQTTPNVFSAITAAETAALGIAVDTIEWDAHCAAFRDAADLISTTYSPSSCGQIIEDEDGLAYLDARELHPSDEAIGYFGPSRDVAYERDASAFGAPRIEGYGIFSGEGLDGVALLFDPVRTQSLTLHDADNVATEGFLVTAVAVFYDLALAEGDTRALVAKSDSGAFALELHHPIGSDAVLRFGVHVSGAYYYATYDVAALAEGDSYFIVAGYDGNGAVRIFVNGVQGTASAALLGGVTANDSPIVIGADPQGATDRRFFFDGAIQRVTVQNWRNH